MFQRNNFFLPTIATALILINPIVSAYAKNQQQTQPVFNRGFEGCLNVFMGKVAPMIMNEKLAQNTYPICFSSFAVNYSGKSKTSVYSAEFLTYDSLQKAKQLSREDSFHEESRLPANVRSLLSDYRGSGFDRGHLSPNGDRYNRLDQSESFSLANMIPQAPKNNQEQWRNIEEAVRTLVTKSHQSAYIITGPLYLENKVQKIGSGVLVPSHIYKVVYFPTLQVAGAYVSVNDNEARSDVVSIMQLQKYSGVTFFPAIKNTALLYQRFDLPMSANAAYRLNRFNSFGMTQSGIFEIMPSHDISASTSKSKSRSHDHYYKYKEYQRYYKDTQKVVSGFFH